MQRRVQGFVAGFSVLLIGLIAGDLRPVRAQGGTFADAGKPAFYTQNVRPIFEANCARCHEGMNHRGGLSMSTRAGMLKGGKHGPAIVPGDANSLLVKLIRHEGPKENPMDMPVKQSKLSDAEVATVTQWVKAGAIMPPDPPVR